jgi:hypothetical protein
MTTAASVSAVTVIGAVVWLTGFFFEAGTTPATPTTSATPA